MTPKKTKKIIVREGDTTSGAQAELDTVPPDEKEMHSKEYNETPMSVGGEHSTDVQEYVHQAQGQVTDEDVRLLLGQENEKKPVYKGGEKQSFFKKLFSGILSRHSNRIGIDLGTASTIAYLAGTGVIINDNTLVTLNVKTNQIIAIGRNARKMLGRTPEYLQVIQPIYRGVISNYEITKQFLQFIIRKAHTVSPRNIHPVLIIGVPCNIRETESNALKSAAFDAGAREVHLMYEPVAAAIGVGAPYNESKAMCIIDIGGGTTDCMVLSGSETITSISIPIAGDNFNESIATGIAAKSGIQVGVRTAEDIKINAMSVETEHKRMIIRGKDVTTGLPREVELRASDIVRMLIPNMKEITQALIDLLQGVPSEILSDLQRGNVYFVGGGTCIKGLREMFEEELHIPVTIPEDPLTAVARGTAKVAHNPNHFKKFFIAE